MTDRLEEMFSQIMQKFEDQRFKQEWFTVEEMAKQTNKAPFTVREWCRLKRINARKTESGRGDAGKEEWRIHHDEIARYKNEGLLPLRKE